MEPSTTRPLSSTIIRASAGTGKTHQLSTRYLQLANRGVDPQNILAVTFTRKAAGEIFARVIQRLVDAAADVEKLQSLAEDLGPPRCDRARCLNLLANLTRQIHLVHVGTLDSYFFQQLARNRRRGLLVADRTMADESAIQRLRADAIKALLQDPSVDFTPLIHWLSSGDASRGIFPLVQKVVDAEYQLYLESEGIGRQGWTLAVPAGQLDAESYEVAVDRLRNLAGLSKSLTNARERAIEYLARQDWPSFLSKGIVPRVLDQGTYHGQAIPVILADAYRPLIAHAQAALVAQLSDYTLAAFELLSQFDRVYESMKERLRIATFDDLPRYLTVEFAARRGGDAPRRTVPWDDPVITHLMLDEFQDTSLAQWRALETIARRTCCSPSHSLLCVGDIKQSIYGWRGGVPELLTSLPQILPGTTTRELVQSHRSSPVIIDLVNRLFGQLPPLAADDKYADAIEHWWTAFERHSTVHTCAGHATLRTARDASDEALIETACDLVSRLHHDKPGASIGVLVVRNEEVASMIYQLRRRGMDASEEGGQPMTDSAAVRILLSALKLADHPGDSISRFHLAHSPLATLVEPDATRRGSNAPADTATRPWRQRLFQDGLGPTLEAWSRELLDWCSDAEWRRVQQMIQHAETWDQRGWTSLSDFVHCIETERVGFPLASAIRVMTVHRAKGLQFDAVVVIGLDGKLLSAPSFAYERDPATLEINRVARYVGQDTQPMLPLALQSMAATTIASMVQERLCVLYVAITRAIHALHIVIKPAAGTCSATSSLAALLRKALVPTSLAPPVTLLLELGQADWQPVRSQEEARAGILSPSALKADVQLNAPSVPWPRRASRPAVFRSPSEMEGNATVAVSELFQTRRHHARHTGSLIHRVLEQITWLRDDEALVPQLARATSAASLDAESSQKILDQLSEWQTIEGLQQVLTGKRYWSVLPDGVRDELHRGTLQLQVRNEQPVLANLGASSAERLAGCDDFCTGVIDRLVMALQHGDPVWAHIIDYKTDDIPSAALASRSEYYRPQLLAYRDLLSRALGIAAECVRADLFFVLSGQLVRMS